MKLIEVDKIERITIPKVVISNESLQEIYDLGQKMIEFIKDKDNEGLGLSACQVGIFKQLFVMKFQNDEFLIIVNPKLKPISSGKIKIYNERCLSLPKETYRIKRYDNILTEFYSVNPYKTKNGYIDYSQEKMVFKGLGACIFQHEYDHNQGMTIRMKGIKYN